MIRAAVLGAPGYGGGELLRLLTMHPETTITLLGGHSAAGKHILDVSPHLRGYVDLMVEDASCDSIKEKADVVFLALPHGLAVDIATALIPAGVKVIDLGADFRFQDTTVYETWYKVKHNNPELAKTAVYGLPELWRDEVKGASLIANPGCYPTSAILGLYPLIQAGIIDLSSLIIDSKSGVTGAGRTPSAGNIYSETNESIKAYGISTHRHTPEIETRLGRIAGAALLVNFTPHLTPMNRGILSTMYANLKPEGLDCDIQALYEKAYADEFFVRVLPKGTLPQTQWVRGSNFCDIGVTVDVRTKRVIVVSAIDNLMKGAAGQAVQNMNLMFGLPENTGLLLPPVFP